MSAPRVVLVLASVGLACEARATPIEPSTEEREVASPLVAPPGIEVDLGSVSAVEAGEDSAAERFDSLSPEASGDEGTSGDPGSFP
jgi:hypothetical protein